MPSHQARYEKKRYQPRSSSTLASIFGSGKRETYIECRKTSSGKKQLYAVSRKSSAKTQHPDPSRLLTTKRADDQQLKEFEQDSRRTDREGQKVKNVAVPMTKGAYQVNMPVHREVQTDPQVRNHHASRQEVLIPVAITGRQESGIIRATEGRAPMVGVPQPQPSPSTKNRSRPTGVNVTKVPQENTPMPRNISDLPFGSALSTHGACSGGLQQKSQTAEASELRKRTQNGQGTNRPEQAGELMRQKEQMRNLDLLASSKPSGKSTQVGRQRNGACQPKPPKSMPSSKAAANQEPHHAKTADKETSTSISDSKRDLPGKWSTSDLDGNEKSCANQPKLTQQNLASVNREYRYQEFKDASEFPFASPAQSIHALPDEPTQATRFANPPLGSPWKSDLTEHGSDSEDSGSTLRSYQSRCREPERQRSGVVKRRHTSPDTDDYYSARDMTTQDLIEENLRYLRLSERQHEQDPVCGIANSAVPLQRSRSRKDQKSKQNDNESREKGESSKMPADRLASSCQKNNKQNQHLHQSALPKKLPQPSATNIRNNDKGIGVKKEATFSPTTSDFKIPGGWPETDSGSRISSSSDSYHVPGQWPGMRRRRS